MLIDLHVHTNRYSACAQSSAEEMMRAAVACGLDAVAITEHHAIWTDAEIADLRCAFPTLRIFRAIEVTTAESEDVLVYGLLDLQVLQARQPALTLMSTIRQAGGAAIVAHPFRYRDHIAEPFYQAPPDACEGWSQNIFAFQRPTIRAFCHHTGCGMIAATDAHQAGSIGAFATRFHDAIGDERELAAALRERAYRPFRDPARLADREASLPARVACIRQGLEQGLDRQTIRQQAGCALSTIDHVQAGRYPSLIGNDDV